MIKGLDHKLYAIHDLYTESVSTSICCISAFIVNIREIVPPVRSSELSNLRLPRVTSTAPDTDPSLPSGAWEGGKEKRWDGGRRKRERRGGEGRGGVRSVGGGVGS